MLAAGALAFQATPAGADGAFPGFDPVERWLRSMPATCAGPQNPGARVVSYWVGSAMQNDAFIPSRPDVRGEGVAFTEADAEKGPDASTEFIIGVYDAPHRIAGYQLKDDNIGFFGVVAAAPPPHGGVVNRMDLSHVALGGNIHLGDTVTGVASEIGLHDLKPTALGSTCPGYSVLDLCDWNSTSCACTHYLAGPHRLGTVVFHDERVVALVWNTMACF
jgi:hypothetical protein